MDDKTWADVKYQQVEMYRQQAKVHQRKGTILTVICVLCGICAVAPFVLFFFGIILTDILTDVGVLLVGVDDDFWLRFLMIAPVFQILWFVLRLIGNLSRSEKRSSQLLTQLAVEIIHQIDVFGIDEFGSERRRQAVSEVETRFLSNDDELFIKKELWDGYLQSIQREIDLDRLEHKLTDIKESEVQEVHFHNPRTYPVWHCDVPHRNGYEDSNTIEDEWAIIKALRKLFWADKYDTIKVLQETSKVARENPVVFERFLRKDKISKKMNAFKRSYGVHYLSAAAKMRLVTFVESKRQIEARLYRGASI
ncbi:MAG: hypothetical protein FWC89_09840 [Defluviitaleaceae bacterium]|nr:hypothetical protein [Defluviitaleaceae bacterium]